MYGDKQKEEIKTIKTRMLKIELSDADVKRITEMTGAHGLTVAELLQNFIGDLVSGTYSNGSDERMYAEQWFDRCWFASFPSLTFLRYLIVNGGGVETAIELWGYIQSGKEEIADMDVHPENYEPDEKAATQEAIDYWQGQFDDYWNDYVRLSTGDYERGSVEEEMEKVCNWKKQQEMLVGET